MHYDNPWTPVLWNSYLVNQIYEPQVARKILTTSLSFCNLEDKLIWSGDNSRNYTAKVSCTLYQNPSSLLNQSFWRSLWSIKLPPKLPLFLWKLLHRAILVSDIFVEHHLILSSTCLNGCDSQETLEHIFFKCPKARAL